MVFTGPVLIGWTRRAVLAGVATAAVSGCSWLERDSGEPPPPDPLEPLLTSTRALAARYQAAVTANSDLADRLQPLLQNHRAHETALLELIGRPELASPSPGTGAWSPPLDEADVLGELLEAERAAREEAGQACLTAPPERVAVLGSIAAARATHAEVLRS
jgi:hypothetical protein